MSQVSHSDIVFMRHSMIRNPDEGKLNNVNMYSNSMTYGSSFIISNAA